ncbi:hypothetical protein CKAH01_09964 [Colletotrichum kahawae]|uniref:Uncharacterized protein n=1 Tax=Colletotrichum kahawae TaxID=34407 RepID=A0AAD9XYS6_COLKA|nr:hypothetical protein CKAH01_09964 [Colletotrichum kahawae]
MGQLLEEVVEALAGERNEGRDMRTLGMMMTGDSNATKGFALVRPNTDGYGGGD